MQLPVLILRQTKNRLSKISYPYQCIIRSARLLLAKRAGDTLKETAGPRTRRCWLRASSTGLCAQSFRRASVARSAKQRTPPDA